jgi:phosphatidylserine decarboxylase
VGSRRLISAAALVFIAAAFAYLFWRHLWFYRDPERYPPSSEGFVSPADGTVVYVKHVRPGEDVVVIKEGVKATVNDILHEDAQGPKVVIGIFMSPFDVHYNRAPLSARVSFVHRHAGRGPNLHMGAMHWRSILGIEPRYTGSMHIVQNERAVTSFEGQYRGERVSFYVVQIGAMTVNGIDSYVMPGESVERGKTFGMIRIGSQVDLIVPWRPDLETRVQPGDRVVAGETIVVR